MYQFTLIIILFLSVALYSKIAKKIGVLDVPNSRSSHSFPVIRGGGILFFIAIVFYFFISEFKYPYFVLGVSIAAIISFIDDIVTLSYKIRLPFHILSVGLCLFNIGFVFDDFIIIIPLLFVGVAFINFFNFMDGINGLTGIYSIIVLLGLMFINLDKNIVQNDLIIYVLYSLIVFGFYNFRTKAKIFAGDIGSISIAIIIFFIGSLFVKELKSLFILLFVLVYGADSILTLIYRKFYIKENITEPHRHHIYQKLVDVKKMSHMHVSFIYGGIQAFINIIVYNTYNLSLQIQFFVFISLCLLFIFIYIYMFKKLIVKV